VANAVDTLSTLRENSAPTEPFDIAVPCAPGPDVAAYAGAGATWWLTDSDPDVLTLDRDRAVIDDGPLGSVE
jgi:hypothetical protein